VPLPSYLILLNSAYPFSGFFVARNQESIQIIPYASFTMLEVNQPSFISSIPSLLIILNLTSFSFLLPFSAFLAHPISSVQLKTLLASLLFQ